jgi:hypothetical protein
MNAGTARLTLIDRAKLRFEFRPGDVEKKGLQWRFAPPNNVRMEKVDKVPDGPTGVGMEHDPSEASEAGGRGKSLLYICFNDGAGNYVDPSWKSFSCWRCGSSYAV